ncbi:MAG: DUF4886 domain-containing protein [Clostridia bacterium]|nr:DUF4886 domain-containing protein [Clostridia bacterium]
MKAMKFTRLLSLVFALLLVFTGVIFLANPKVSAAVTESSLSATHELLDWKPNAGSYWNSTGGIKLLTDDTPFANQYIGSAVRFTKEDIPVGSYIFIDSGYRYRPEGWQNATDKNTGERPANVTTSCVEVTEEWWGDFTLRAFQIQNTESSKKYTVEGDSTNYTWDLRANFDEAKTKLRIYVPKKTVTAYKQLELTWTSGFYSSEGTSTNINSGSDLAKQFICTQIFTREDIPVGSYIEVDSGYKYRPEGWTQLGVATSPRPDNVSASRVDVTEEWWGNFNYRAFNISGVPQVDISDKVAEASKHFRIYVPTTETAKEAPEFEWTLGYWDSSSRFDISQGSDLAKCFVASQRFTKEDLPVGTVITIDSGYKYRPDGWIDLETKNTHETKPGNVTTASVTVTEEWWGDFNYRGFNISTTAQGDISENYLEVASHFNITLPDGTKYAHPKKTPRFVWTHGCYSSTSNSKITTTGSFAIKYAASQIFTKDDIPVGSVITVDSGYYYRPEGWVSLDTPNATRPSTVSTKSVTVTEEWWGDFNYRAFNVSNNPAVDLTDDNYLEVASHFNITLPDGTKFLHPGQEEEPDEPVVPDEPTETPNPIVIPEAEDGVLRLLSIGNSYSNDAQAYIAKIAEGLGLKIEFYNLYYGGCKIEQHYNFYNNNSANYDFYKNMTRYVSGKVTIKNALEATQYDYITFQQGSYSSDSYSSYALLDELMAIVRGYQPNAEFLIHQTWSYCEARSCNGDEANKSGKGYASSAEMFKKVEECYARAAADNGNLRILKSGKAVQMAKTEYYFTDDYGKTNSIYSDFNSHLAPRGDYLAGCVWLETIFDNIDVRETTYDGGFADAALLREIAYRVVNGTDGAEALLGEGTSVGEKPVVKNVQTDGFSYDGRARITLYNATNDSAIKVFYQNEDGTIPALNGIPEGEFYLTVERNGYLTYTTEDITVTSDTDFDVTAFELIAGDIKNNTDDFCGDGIIDIDDFVRVLKGFDPNVSNEVRTIVDINGDGVVNVTDLSFVKQGFARQTK